MGKDGARAQWHIYHVPAMIRHPEGKLAGQTSDYFASTHDVSRTLLSFMGVRAPGMMEGEDLSVLFDGREPADAAALHLLLRQLPALRRPRLVPAVRQRGAPQAPLRQARRPARSCTTWPPSTREIVDRLWQDPRGRGRRHAAPVRRRPARQGGDRRVSLTRRGAAAPRRRHRRRRRPAGEPGRHPPRRRPTASAGKPGSSALLVVLPLVRSDYVKAFEGPLGHRHAEPERADRQVAALRPRGPGVHARAAGAAHARDRHALVPVPRLEAHRRDAATCRATTRSGTGSRS